MASAQRRSGTRGRPPPKRWVFTRSGSSGLITAHSPSDIRKPVVVLLFGVRARERFAAVSVLIPPSLPVIRIGTKDTHARFAALPVGVSEVASGGEVPHSRIPYVSVLSGPSALIC